MRPALESSSHGAPDGASESAARAILSRAPPRRELALSGAMASSLEAIAALSDQKAKIEKYSEALQAALSADNADGCKAFVEHSASDTLRGAAAPRAR